jgi:Fe-S cluster assembly protein SufD
VGFTAETLETSVQGEPDWLRDRRRAALATYERLPMPSRTDEEWRRTDIAGLDLSAYAKLEHANGLVQETPRLPKGVIFEPLATAAANHRTLVEPLLFSTLHAERDRFSALHAAFFTGGNFLYVPDGVVIEEPILRQHFSHEGGSAVLPHTVIVAGRGSRFYYLDEYIGEEAEGAGYRSGSAEIFVGEGAEVGYVSIQKWGRHAWHLARGSRRIRRSSFSMSPSAGASPRRASRPRSQAPARAPS